MKNLSESDKGMLLGISDLPDFRIRGTLVSVSADTKGLTRSVGSRVHQQTSSVVSA